MNTGMRRQARTSLVILAVLGSACGGSMKTGTISRPDAFDEPICPSDTTLCGTGDLAICTDLQKDPEHCGACGKACPSGVACAAGVCQRILCHGQPLLTAATPPPSTPTLDSTFGGTVLADVNGDGLLDFVVWHLEGIYGPGGSPRTPSTGGFSISLGQVGGGFGAAQDYATERLLWGVQVADINHDGADDLFLLMMSTPCRELWLGHTDGPPALSPDFPVADCGWGLAFADVSGDGYLDVVAGSTVSVYLSEDAGNLKLSRRYAPSSWTDDVVIKDWNGDGSPDLLVMGPTLHLFYNRGDGTFDDGVDCGLAVNPEFLASDFNHDGHMDLAMKQSYGLDVLLGMGGCRFAPVAVYELARGCDVLKSADMDGDGQLDLLCMSDDGVFTGFFGNPDGTFQAAPSLDLTNTAGFDGIVVGDVTGDGRPDLVVADRHGPVSIWENTCR
jgi:hypothetical protein